MGDTQACTLQKLAKQGDSEAVGEALVAEGNESRAACHPVARGSVKDIRVEIKAWQSWTVQGDGSPLRLQMTTPDDERYWMCRNC